MYLFVFLTFAITAGSAPQGLPPSTSDLDRFMEQVLARRAVNRKMLNDYVLDETERFEILGPGRVPLSRMKREYTWYVRDGMHVRSPVRFDGVEVGDAARDQYERTWLQRERDRQERDAKRELALSGADLGPGKIPTEPRFVSEAYFMDFKFEPGNYLLAGREQLEGHEVLRIEYYPTRLFSDRDEKPRDEEPRDEKHKDTGETRRERERDEDIERRMNKTALVTLWVDPEEHQIVKYTFDNVWLDFLPGAWLVRVDDIRASMTMGQPFPGVWLPREITIHGGATLASGSFTVDLSRAFAHYREAQVSTKVKVPRPSTSEKVPDEPTAVDPADDSHGPLIGDQEPPQPAVEIVREIRVHGNAFLTDDEVLVIAGATVGAPLAPESITAIKQRLEESGRFETVDVRKRYRSLSDPTDVALVLVVHERPGVRSAREESPAAAPFRRLRSQLMFLPIVSYADGYGFTYGARFSTVDLLGGKERLSVPLTWGGTRRAALEFERAFNRSILTRVTSSVSIWNRENPRYDLDEQRVEVKAGAEREFAGLVRMGIDGSRSSVTFGALDDSQWTVGTTVALDTRADPAFPANAVYVGGGWTGLHLSDGPRVNRYTADARGYLRLFGQTVLAGRAQFFTSDATLPPYDRLLLGGASTLRGFRPGSFDGDRMTLTSAEVRVPITSVISGAKLGITLFADAAKVGNYGSSFADAKWHQGAGAGVFLIASIVKVNLDVAHGFDGGGTRVHLASGFSF